MEAINKISVLNSKIRDLLKDGYEDIDSPITLTFCIGLGEPTFKITIQILEGDFFIDAKGQKWIKSK